MSEGVRRLSLFLGILAAVAVGVWAIGDMSGSGSNIPAGGVVFIAALSAGVGFLVVWGLVRAVDWVRRGF